MEKSQEFLYMEEVFAAIKLKKNVNENLKTLSRICGRLFETNITFQIVENTSNNFFGMTVYPAEGMMDVFVDSVINKKSKRDHLQRIWGANMEWYIDIDSLLLYDTGLMANPSEIVAVLLHEIGHIIYSDTIPMRINKVLRLKLLELKYEVYQICKDDKFKKLFNLIVLDSCANKNYTSRRKLKTETIADQFAQKYGYGDSLYNFIDKLLKRRGNSIIDRTERDMEIDIEAMSTWVIENITELQFRKNKLRTALENEKLRHNSSFVRSVITKIHRKIFGDRKDTYREVLAESMGSTLEFNYYDLEADQILSNYVKNALVSENAIVDFFDKFGKIKKITQSDIDVIRVEADRIENHDDKIYVLDRIYGVMVIVDRALDFLAQGRKNKVQQSKSTLEDFKKQLMDIRTYVTTLRIVEKEYGVFVKYPKGYEG